LCTLSGISGVWCVFLSKPNLLSSAAEEALSVTGTAAEKLSVPSNGITQDSALLGPSFCRIHHQGKREVAEKPEMYLTNPLSLATGRASSSTPDRGRSEI
jgi:hypothetical protein